MSMAQIGFKKKETRISYLPKPRVMKRDKERKKITCWFQLSNLLPPNTENRDHAPDKE